MGRYCVPDKLFDTLPFKDELALFQQIAGVLHRRNAQQSYGIFKAHSAPDVKEGFVLVEDYPRSEVPGLIHGLPMTRLTGCIETHWMLGLGGRRTPTRFCRLGVLDLPS
jgi:hypothetical protein